MPLPFFATPLIADFWTAHILFPWWAWGIFSALGLFLFVLDLGVFRKQDKIPSMKNALAWVGVWVAFAAAFGIAILLGTNAGTAETFAAGYLLELALSVDNLFVFLLVFSSFKIPEEYQHRVLFWGIIGAVLMRAIFIGGGITLVQQFSWLMILFGGFLVFTAVKMLVQHDTEEKDFGKSLVARIAPKIFPSTPDLDGHNFFTRKNGSLQTTRLFLALVAIEAADVIFAMDSIPAVLGILPPDMDYRTRLLVAFTSNILAVLGLRSLFFALSGFMGLFRYLKQGLVAILAFIGVKMLLAELLNWHISVGISLGIVVGFLAIAIAASILCPPKKTDV